MTEREPPYGDQEPVGHGYVIWSFEHQQWWRPNRQGYTPHLEEAGRYTALEAGDIVTSSYLCEEIAISEPVAERHGPPTVRSLWQEVDSHDDPERYDHSLGGYPEKP